jgi:hypothetical protein
MIEMLATLLIVIAAPKGEMRIGRLLRGVGGDGDNGLGEYA